MTTAQEIHDELAKVGTGIRDPQMERYRHVDKLYDPHLNKGLIELNDQQIMIETLFGMYDNYLKISSSTTIEKIQIEEPSITNNYTRTITKIVETIPGEGIPVIIDGFNIFNNLTPSRNGKGREQLVTILKEGSKIVNYGNSSLGNGEEEKEPGILSRIQFWKK